ncbi:hypothetical protein D1007_52852 [Hordeum vulgare]|nr:hypothetical protein D1007_52852 [Hordeum vulgare]
MEAVDGLIRGLRLTEDERRGVKVRVPGKDRGKTPVAQAVGKVVSEKLAHPDAIRLSLGRVWCPIKGIECKEVGENLFVFTLHQESGKRRALEDGPWMFENDLVVVEDYDPGKRTEDYEFKVIPIWMRVFSLPLGMMNVVTAEEIGNLVGSFVEADVGADGEAMGKFMRVKIRMNIDKPLMREFMLDDAEEGGRQKQKKKMNIDGGGEEEEGAWCRFEYEFLPEFCYVCGMVGHSERACDMHLDKNRWAQFGGWLRADMSHRKAPGDESGSWRGRGRGSGVSRPFGSSRSQEKTGSGSDGLSWRKESSRSTEGRSGDAEKGEEVTSPAKQNAHALQGRGQPKKLQLVMHGGGVPDNRKQTEEMAPAAERVISNPAGKDLEYDATSPLGNPGEEGQFHPTSQ